MCRREIKQMNEHYMQKKIDKKRISHDLPEQKLKSNEPNLDEFGILRKKIKKNLNS